MRIISAYCVISFCMIGVVHSPACADEFLYINWELLLKECVRDGAIDFDALRDNQIYLHNFIRDIELLDYETFSSWSHKEKLAFWINTYHAFSFLLILKNPYAHTIKEIRESPRDKLFTIFGENVSLNHLKHTIIRGPFLDERIHCTLSSLARGFPPMRNEAYLGISLNLLLDEDVRTFLASPGVLRIKPTKDKIHISHLFKWFGGDFVKNYSTHKKTLSKFTRQEAAVMNFIAAYRQDQREFIMSGDYTIEYIDFDWTINRSDVDAKPLKRSRPAA